MKTIPTGNDWEMIWPGTRRNAATGITEPAAGIAGLLGWLSATDRGATIHATLSKSMAERASTPGEYFAIIEGTDLTAQLLPTYAGQVIYEVFGDSGNVLYSVPRKVVDTRRP